MLIMTKMRKFVIILMMVLSLCALCACSDDEKKPDRTVNDFVGTYYGENGSVLTLLSDGTSNYYYVGYREMEIGNPWSYENKQVKWHYQDSNADIYADVTDDANNLCFKCNNFLKWDNENYLKVSNEDRALSYEECYAIVDNQNHNLAEQNKGVLEKHNDSQSETEPIDTVVSEVEEEDREVEDVSEEEVQVKYATATTKVKIRKEPNTDCDVISMLEEGNKVEVLDGETDEWSHIKYGEYEGYVKNEFLDNFIVGSSIEEATDNLSDVNLEEALSKLVCEEDKVANTTFYKPNEYPKYTNVRTFFLPYLATRDNACVLHIKANYYNGDWVFWNKLIVAVDDDRYEMNLGWLETTSSDIDGSGNVVEQYDFTDLSSRDIEMLRSIISSNETIVRFQGSDKKYDYTLKDSDKKAIADVLTAYDLFEIKR